MTHHILTQAQTEDAWHERNILQNLKSQVIELTARNEISEYQQTAGANDTPQAA